MISKFIGFLKKIVAFNMKLGTVLLLVFLSLILVSASMLYRHEGIFSKVHSHKLCEVSVVSADARAILARTEDGYALFRLSPSRHDVVRLAIEVPHAEWGTDNAIKIFQNNVPVYDIFLKPLSCSIGGLVGDGSIQDATGMHFLCEQGVRELLAHPRLASGGLFMTAGANRVNVYPVGDNYIYSIDADESVVLVSGNAGAILTNVADGAQVILNQDVAKDCIAKYFILPGRSILLRVTGYFSNNGHKFDGAEFNLCDFRGHLIRRLPISVDGGDSFEAIRLILARNQCIVFSDSRVYIVEDRVVRQLEGEK